MKNTSETDKRIAHYLRQMEKAMPEVKRQIAVYEKSLKSGKSVKPVKISTSI
jgi:hypothetical protein